MVTVLSDPSGLAAGISGAGSAFANALNVQSDRMFEENQYQKRRQERKEDYQRQLDIQKQQTMQYGNILSKTLGSLPDDASQLDIFSAFNAAVSQGLPIDIARDMSSVYKATKDSQKAGGALGIENRDELVDLLSRFGMQPEQATREADLYVNLPTGGKTAYANYLFERMQRGQLGQPSTTEEVNIVDAKIPGGPSPDVSDVEVAEVRKFQFPKVDLFQDLTSKEKVDRQKELFNTNAKEFADIKAKRHSYEDELRRLGQMNRLNESGRLPQGLEKLNINWTTGDIRVPALANPETQLFVKSVNDFTTKAKDTYGARVTNFELGTFMRRLPTLANSTEGRRLIIDQMTTNAALEKLYQDSLSEVYQHYGLRGIDPEKAEKLAEDLRKDDEEALLKNYETILQRQEVQEARQLAPEGKIPARDPEGRVVYIWRNQADKAEKKGYTIL